MELVTIEKEKFNDLAQEFLCNNFFQTTMMGDTLEQKGKEVYYLGLEDEGIIKAIAMLSEKESFLGKKNYQALKGFLVDYKDTKVVEEFSNKLLDFVKSKGGFKLTIDPYIINAERDIDGNVVDGGKSNYDVIDCLKKIGFIKSKRDIQVRFNFCLDLEKKSEEKVFKNFKATTRNIINKGVKEGVEVFDLSYEELDDFKKITEYTCEKKGFPDKTLEYYQMMFKTFKENVVFKMARLNVKKYHEYLDKSKLEYMSRIEKVSGKKKDNYIFELQNIEKKLDRLKNFEDQEYIDLAVGMFMLYGNETIYLFSGSYDEYMEFGGQYLIQWEIIKYAINHGYRRHNFFGIMNFKDKNDPNYGIYLFKRGFDGYVEELLGEYYICTSSVISLIYKLKEKLR